MYVTPHVSPSACQLLKRTHTPWHKHTLHTNSHHVLSMGAKYKLLLCCFHFFFSLSPTIRIPTGKASLSDSEPLAVVVFHGCRYAAPITEVTSDDRTVAQ